MSTPLHFHIANWAAWAPGIHSEEQWQAFFAGRLAIDANETADVGFLPAMQRRRLSTLARAAFHVSEKVMQNAEPCPSLFCSTSGETHRTFALLNDIAQKNDVSPTAFSLSVHNAIAGQYSIFFNNTHPNSAIAASREQFLLPFADALGLLHEGAESILVVFYEESLPEFYQRYAPSIAFPCALALRITRSTNTDTLLQYHPETAPPPEQTNPLLALIDYLANKKTQLSLGNWSITQQ